MQHCSDNALFKFQLAINLPSDSEAKETDACQDFLKAFMPVVNHVIFASDEEPAAATAAPASETVAPADDSAEK